MPLADRAGNSFREIFAAGLRAPIFSPEWGMRATIRARIFGVVLAFLSMFMGWARDRVALREGRKRQFLALSNLSKGKSQRMRYVLAGPVYLAITSVALGAFDVSNPSASGYVLTFDSEFNSLDGIDVKGSGAPGYKWYITRFQDRPVTGTRFSVQDGVLTISPTMQTNAQIFSAAPGPQPTGYVGQVFAGGFYVEAKIAFDNTKVDTRHGWPSFWARSLEYAMGADQWPGQAQRYEHFIEDDFFEYDLAAEYGPDSFGSSLHDWYGIIGSSCPRDYCSISNTNGVIHSKQTNWAAFHTIGQLWAPGNAGNGWQGAVTNYFDGNVVSTISWKDEADAPPPPTKTSAFSITDKQRLIIILGTGKGQTLQVSYVRVWQLPH